MNYEEKYKEDLESAKGWLAIAKENNNNLAIQMLEKLFPELRESEDERIRKELISFITDRKNWFPKEETKASWIAWLEKQSDQKSQCKSAFELWKDMRFEVYQQASGNRHEPNCSDDSTKMFSLNDIDEIFEKVAEKQGEQKPAEIDENSDMVEALRTEYEKGRFDMRKEMMEDAVDAIICNGIEDKYVREVEKDAISNALSNFNFDDKVKIIIIKSEQQ